MLVDDAAEIRNLLRRRCRRAKIAAEAAVGGANQREIALERQGKDHTLVARPENIAAVVLEQLAHHDVAAFIKPQARRRRLMQNAFIKNAGPWSGSVDQHTRGHALLGTAGLKH